MTAKRESVSVEKRENCKVKMMQIKTKREEQRTGDWRLRGLRDCGSENGLEW